jgi:hypothetical protein
MCTMCVLCVLLTHCIVGAWVAQRCMITLHSCLHLLLSSRIPAAHHRSLLAMQAAVPICTLWYATFVAIPVF